MSIATGLIAKLLLATSVIPAAGYGGYCAYDHYNPTFHNQLIQQGFLFSPISGDLGTGEDIGKRRDEIAIGGDWRCSKQLFTDITTPATDTNKSAAISEEGASIPSAPSDSSEESTDSIGCLVADLGHVKETSKKAGFIKWELALRSGNRGFIYVGFFSIGSSQYTTGATDVQRTATESVSSFSTIFEVAKEENEWKIKHGLNWSDYFTNHDASSVGTTGDPFSNVEIKISLPNNYEWKSNGTICNLVNESDSNKCPDKEGWTFERYVGFWEQKENEDGKQVTDAIKISATKDNTEHLHDIWSNQNFDFSKSTQKLSEKPAWGGSLSHVYDVASNKWKSAPTNSNDATDYLKAIYSPWANKKGTWMEAEGVCYESNSRSLGEDSAEAQRLLKFCYKK